MDELLIALFGTSKIEELAVPMLIGLAAFTCALFWVISHFSKRRQQRLIEVYDHKMSEHSKQLRRIYAKPRK